MDEQERFRPILERLQKENPDKKIVLIKIKQTKCVYEKKHFLGLIPYWRLLEKTITKQ